MRKENEFLQPRQRIEWRAYLLLSVAFIGHLLPQFSRAGDDRSDLLNRFKALQQASAKTIGDRGLGVSDVQWSEDRKTFQVFKQDGPTKLRNLDTALQNANGDQLGYAIWGEAVRDQKLVNLANYRWQSGERFKIYFKAAVPLYLTIYQEMDNGRAEQRHPDPKQDASGRVLVQPGQTICLGLFHMDANDQTEKMLIRVARFDAVKRDPSPPEDDEGTTKDWKKGESLANREHRDLNAAWERGKFQHQDDNSSGKDTSNEEDEVAWVFVSREKVAEHRLSLNKR
jgi:hypothetical protein